MVHTDPVTGSRAQKVLFDVSLGTATSREDFLPVFVQRLAEALEVPFVYVTRISPRDPGMMEVLCAWEDDRLGGGFEYPKKATPCAQVLEKGTLVWPRGVMDAFPTDEFLRSIGAISYVGSPLFDRKGRPIGHLCVIGREEIEDEPLFRVVLQILAARASVEVQRIDDADHADEQERRLATLLSNLPGLVYRSRLDAEWTKEFVSDGCLELTGYTPEDFLLNRVTITELIDRRDRQRNRASVLAAIRDRRQFTFIFRMRDRHEKWKWVWERGCGIFDEGGKAIAIEGFITDISEVKSAQRALVDQKLLTEEMVENRTLVLERTVEGFRRIADELVEVLGVYEMETGRPAFVGCSFHDYTGVDADEFLESGSPILDFVEEPNETERKAIGRELAAGAMVDRDVSIRHVSGSLRRARVRLVPVRNTEGTLVRVVGLVRNADLPTAES